MRIIRYDSLTGEMKIVAENNEDLWHLDKIIEPNDLIKSSSFRRFKTDEGESGEKKQVNLDLIAEKIEFAKHANKLRITGIIKSGSPEEYVQIGSYHTIDVELHKPFVVIKQWRDFQLKRLKEAEKETKKPKLGIVVLDDEKAIFSKVTPKGIDVEFEIYSHASKKDKSYEDKVRLYYLELTKKLESLELYKVVVAGPGFTKDNLKKFIQDRYPDILPKLVFERCNSAEVNGIHELIKSGIAERLIGEIRVEQEAHALERFLEQLSKDRGLVAYGIPQVKEAVNYGAIEELYIADDLIRQNKELDDLLQKADKQKSKVLIFSVENNAGKQLMSFKGIAAILKFKIVG
ncbi:mRNA surveillance protein pelota [Candidatus Micrarchaeota archaeon]|nr:mRNA surveillance protein pelota [Candidatus Micrarchaeota archaeon]